MKNEKVNYLQTLLEYDYKMTPAYQRMQRIIGGIVKEDNGKHFEK